MLLETNNNLKSYFCHCMFQKCLQLIQIQNWINILTNEQGIQSMLQDILLRIRVSFLRKTLYNFELFRQNLSLPKSRGSFAQKSLVFFFFSVLVL